MMDGLPDELQALWFRCVETAMDRAKSDFVAQVSQICARRLLAALEAKPRNDNATGRLVIDEMTQARARNMLKRENPALYREAMAIQAEKGKRAKEGKLPPTIDGDALRARMQDLGIL